MKFPSSCCCYQEEKGTTQKLSVEQFPTKSNLLLNIWLLQKVKRTCSIMKTYSIMRKITCSMMRRKSLFYDYRTLCVYGVFMPSRRKLPGCLKTEDKRKRVKGSPLPQSHSYTHSFSPIVSNLHPVEITWCFPWVIQTTQKWRHYFLHFFHFGLIYFGVSFLWLKR